uniref:Uncharacterized protein n=1 Tax=Arundo donax TaxID=35708 RepID=A0A0A9H4L1_ARUDO
MRTPNPMEKEKRIEGLHHTKKRQDPEHDLEIKHRAPTNLEVPRSQENF